MIKYFILVFPFNKLPSIFNPHYAKQQMMISKTCKYGIRAVLYIASRSPDNIKLNCKDIAREIDAPEAFTAKILQILNKHKIITSLKGPYGGFYIEEHQLGIPLMNIVNAIDGLAIFSECGLGLKQCSETHPCPMHNEFKLIRNDMTRLFNETTIKGLVDRLSGNNEYNTFLI